MADATRPRLSLLATLGLGVVLVPGTALAPGALSGQTSAPRGADAPPAIRVTNPRLAHALDRLAAGSPTAAATLRALETGGLVVTIGTPGELAALPAEEGGPAPRERDALLAGLARETSPEEPPMAWMAFRVTPTREGLGEVERAWVVVEVDSIVGRIRAATADAAEARIEADLLAILAHELVAHVGSVAATRRLEDFCDDPDPAKADGLGCSLEVENRVRRELNRGLRLTGAARLPERTSYALDVMNFARVRSAGS